MSADTFEDPREVARAVAAILDSPAVEGDLPHEIQETRRFGSAARRILEAHLPLEYEVVLLVGLWRQAMSAALPEFCMHAVLQVMAEAGEDPLEEPSSELAILRLLRSGCQSCPTCKRQLPPAVLIERRRKTRELERRRRDLRRGAA